MDSNRVHGQNAFEEKAVGDETSSQENGSVCNKSGNTWLSLSKDYTNRPHMVTSRDYNQSPINYLTFTAVLLKKIIGFQISLFISVFALPIWLSYFCFISLLFPLLLRQIRVYFMKKLWSFWGVAHMTVTSAISKRVKAQKIISNEDFFHILWVNICFFPSFLGC